MICYRDKTYCGSYLLCKKGSTCPRAKTPEVVKKAKDFGLPICEYAVSPECFVRFFENEGG